MCIMRVNQEQDGLEVLKSILTYTKLMSGKNLLLTQSFIKLEGELFLHLPLSKTFYYSIISFSLRNLNAIFYLDF